MFRKTLLLIAILALVSCGGNVQSVKTLAEQQKANPRLSKSNSSYVIGPGDILAIDVWKEPDLSKEVSVRLDGIISLPLLDDVRASGLTCDQLRNYLELRYRDYVELAEVSVTLKESRSKKIYLLGKVNRPGEYLLQKNMTIVQAISLAEGLAEWADTEDIRLIRKIDGVEQTFRVDYDAIVSGDDLSQNVQLQPDDTIFVP
jgi:polysaccharide export outer membrane protein